MRKVRRGWAQLAAITPVVLLAVMVTSAQGDDACGELRPDSIVESDAFTPAEQRRSNLPPMTMGDLAEGALPPVGDDLLAADGTLDGLSVQVAVSVGGGYHRFLSDKPVAATTTFDEFMASGGIHLLRNSIETGDFGAFLLEQLGERAVPVFVGPYPAALTWADPTVGGVRTHNLYWADEEFNYGLIAVREPEDIVMLGRSLVCGR